MGFTLQEEQVKWGLRCRYISIEIGQIVNLVWRRYMFENKLINLVYQNERQILSEQLIFQCRYCEMKRIHEWIQKAR